MAERLIGEVTHYYGRIGVAAVRLSGRLKVGDRVHVFGRGADFEQEVASMEIEHQPIAQALPGQEIGLQVADKVREGNRVYLVS